MSFKFFFPLKQKTNTWGQISERDRGRYSLLLINAREISGSLTVVQSSRRNLLGIFSKCEAQENNITARQAGMWVTVAWMVRTAFISAGRTPAKTKAWVVRCCVAGRNGVVSQPLPQEEGMFCSTLQHRLISYTVHFWLNYLEFCPHVWYEEGLAEFYDWHHLYRVYQCPRWCVLTCVLWTRSICVCVSVCVWESVS